MGYWIYYLLFGVAWYAIEHPIVLVPIVAFFALKRFIPDPWVLAKTFANSRRLRDQVRANPSNVTARRDLAMIYLQRLRPKKALAVLGPAIEREPESAELQYLLGVASLRSGNAEASLAPLVAAVDKDPGVRFGDAYRVAGDALMKLSRHDGAIDAYEHFVEINSSSVEGWAKLSMAHKAAGEGKDADKALREAKRTWAVLPGYKRRQEWRWRLRAQLLSAGL